MLIVGISSLLVPASASMMFSIEQEDDTFTYEAGKQQSGFLGIPG
ncbi:MAG: hypothetical protein ABIE74_10260 [Pseudomonadota bacterium]